MEIIRQRGNDLTDLQIFTRIDHAQGQIIELQKKKGSEQIVRSFWLVVKKVVQLPINVKVSFLKKQTSSECFFLI